MNSLVFLLVKSAKNTVLELRRKPAKLLLWVLVLAGMGMLLLGSLFAPPAKLAPWISFGSKAFCFYSSYFLS